MKKLLTFCVAISFFALSDAQEKTSAKLENLYKIEAGIQGVSAGAELPLGDRFLADIGVGWGGVYDFDNGISYAWGKNSSSLFLRGQLRYYLNREQREAKGHSLRSNSGTFLAVQSKFVPAKQGGIYKSETNWLNELQFGQQLPLGNHFLFRYQAGVGIGTQTDYHTSKAYPALGFAFGYRF